MNREFKDFTEQTPGGFARELRDLCYLSAANATCKERKLAKVSLVPDPSLVLGHPGQSILICPGASLSPRGEWPGLNATRPLSPLSEERDIQNEAVEQECSFVVVGDEGEDCLTLTPVAPPLWQANLESCRN